MDTAKKTDGCPLNPLKHRFLRQDQFLKTASLLFRKTQNGKSGQFLRNENTESPPLEVSR